MSIRPETQDKYRKALIEIFSSVKRSEKIVPSTFCVKHSITAIFISTLVDMKILEPTQTRFHYKWIENKLKPKLANESQYFIELAKLIGDKLSETSKIAQEKKVKKNDQLNALITAKAQEMIKNSSQEHVVFGGPFGNSATKIHPDDQANLDKIEQQEVIMEIGFVQSMPERIELHEPEYDFVLGMTKAEGRLMMTLLADNDNPYLKRFVDTMSDRIFQKIF